jgi:hypothetical protein
MWGLFTDLMIGIPNCLVTGYSFLKSFGSLRKSLEFIILPLFENNFIQKGKKTPACQEKLSLPFGYDKLANRLKF